MEIFKRVLISSLAVSVFALGAYMVLEPQIIKSQESDLIVVSQSVTSEISITQPSNVTLSPSLPGVTGGTASGTATWTVTTNNNAGFTMTLIASSSPAMQGATQGGSIPDYTTATTTEVWPDYTWSVGANAAEFGYTVNPETAADTATAFRDNGADTCNTGSNNGVDTCWLYASTTAVTIINRTSETGSTGEDEVVKFRLQITSSPNPLLAEDTYTATTTVTVTMN